jgi:hypothetical protein
MAEQRIGILTGGGDVPGLNAVIKSVTHPAARTASRLLAYAVAGKLSPTLISRIRTAGPDTSYP